MGSGSPDGGSQQHPGPSFLALLFALLLAAPALATPDEREGKDRRSAEDAQLLALPERHRQWLEDVEPLISDLERKVFLALTEDYRREAFIRRFWKVRDPFPQTVRNELQERWETRATEARELFGDLSDERGRMWLYFGKPTHRETLRCSLLREDLEIWTYAEGTELVGGYFHLVFMGVQAGRRGFFRLWNPREGLNTLIDPARSIGNSSAQLGALLVRDCPRGSDLLATLAQTLEVHRLPQQEDLFPTPNEEWVRSFRARSTELPQGAELFPAEVAISYPGRHQSRTVVQGLVTVPRDALTTVELGEYQGYSLLVDGEVLRKDELFDQFRYRFDLPIGRGAGALLPEEVPGADDAGEAPGAVPLVVQRYLRPGDYRLVLKVEDTAGERFYREEMSLQVPWVEHRRAALRVTADGQVTAAGEAAPAADALAATRPAGSSLASHDTGADGMRGRPMRWLDDGPSPLADRLAEANATISTGETSIRILSLPDILHVGRLRVEARTRGEGIDRVAFQLNGRPVMSKSRPPYSVELDLGDKPRIHRLEAVALDAEGNRVATDEVMVNSGPHRFDIRLIEPQRGRTYVESVRVHAEVDVPEGEILDRVELFLNDTRVTTLYQPPFEQPLLLGDAVNGDRVSYIRALAFLRNGDQAEDVQFINAPDFVDEMRVSFVALYTTVLDKRGNFIEDLEVDDFEVLEEGRMQSLRRFEHMRDLPIRAGLVIDTSLSMAAILEDVERAAYQFLENVMTERDRAAIISFADEPRLRVRFTGDQQVLAGGLAGLDAEGETALFDSIIFTLHYFSGLKGKRAMIVLTDGEDSMSKYAFDDAVEFARRTGVAIYIIGLDMRTNQPDARSKLIRLARETGGETFFIDHVHALERVYDSIQTELRSQYLLAYQSSSEDDGFREVEVRMLAKGLEAKTIRGYYP
ncbi:MAG: VWA domain-containing protein [Holophagales bacterium]|nr:VWA domain-containing protein [Holophagales bacterium]